MPITPACDYIYIYIYYRLERVLITIGPHADSITIIHLFVVLHEHVPSFSRYATHFLALAVCRLRGSMLQAATLSIKKEQQEEEEK